MEENERLIVWNKVALDFLAKTLEDIAEYSYDHAERVENSILEKLQAAVKMPERFSADKYKISNPGTYRAFEVHNFRVAYRFTNLQIRVLRIRHVRQNPIRY